MGLMLLLRWLLSLSRVLFELDFKIMDVTSWLVVLVRVFCASYSCLWDLSLILGFSGIGPHFDLSPNVGLMLLLRWLPGLSRVWFQPDFKIMDVTG